MTVKRTSTVRPGSVGTAATTPSSAGTAAGSAGMQHSASTATDADLSELAASRSGPLLLRPIQPMDRSLRRFALQGAAFDRLAQAWVRPPHEVEPTGQSVREPAS